MTICSSEIESGGETIVSHRCRNALSHGNQSTGLQGRSYRRTEKRRQAVERTPGSSPMPKCKRIKKAWFASFDPAYSTTA